MSVAENPIPDVELEAIPNPTSTVVGNPIPPLERIEGMNEDDWEKFTQEWVYHLKSKYKDVFRCGGSGDMGRDVIAYTAAPGVWDNYQCKHYANLLTPSDIQIEIAKLCYYTYLKEYSLPASYYFISPRGPGPKLISLLNNPSDLRSSLYKSWDTQCRNVITKKNPVELTGDFKAYVDGLDFSIFEAVSPLKILEWHRETPYYVMRFGGGIPVPRPKIKQPVGGKIENFELNYITALLRAYSSAEGKEVDLANIPSYAPYHESMNHARANFYSAESLREFSRDWLPDQSYQFLLDDFLEGIRDEWDEDHPDGFAKLKAVSKLATQVKLDGHALNNHILLADRKGFCHQITNQKKKSWVKE